jgi:hypothetical protein
MAAVPVRPSLVPGSLVRVSFFLFSAFWHGPKTAHAEKSQVLRVTAATQAGRLVTRLDKRESTRMDKDGFSYFLRQSKRFRPLLDVLSVPCTASTRLAFSQCAKLI